MAGRLLVVEDDRLFSETLEDFLEESGFGVRTAASAEEALELQFGEKFDLYLLDINLPGMAGNTLLASLRESGDSTPALFLTSHTEKAMLVEGFRAGCDDYLTKPVDLEELLLRISALLRRSGKGSETVRLDDAILFDPARNVLAKEGREEPLEPMAGRLLSLLAAHRGNTVTREMIEEALYPAGETPSPGAVRVYVAKLKKLLGNDRLVNIRGIGYRLEKE